METEVYNLSPDLNVQVVARKLLLGYGITIRQKRISPKVKKAKSSLNKEEEEEVVHTDAAAAAAATTAVAPPTTPTMIEEAPMEDAAAAATTPAATTDAATTSSKASKKRKSQRQEKWSAVKKMHLSIREWRRLKEVLPDVLADYRAFEAALADDKDVYFNGYRRRISPNFVLSMGPPDNILISDNNDDEHYEVALIDLNDEEEPEIGDDRIKFTETELSRLCNLLPIINRRLIQHLSRDKVITLQNMADVVRVNSFVNNFYDGESTYTRIVLLKKAPPPGPKKTPVVPSTGVEVNSGDGAMKFRIIGVPPHSGVVVDKGEGVISEAIWQEIQLKRNALEEGPDGRLRQREQEKMNREAGEYDDRSEDDLSSDDEMGWMCRNMKESYEEMRDKYKPDW